MIRRESDGTDLHGERAGKGIRQAEDNRQPVERDKPVRKGREKGSKKSGKSTRKAGVRNSHWEPNTIPGCGQSTLFRDA